VYAANVNHYQILRIAAVPEYLVPRQFLPSLIMGDLGYLLDHLPIRIATCLRGQICIYFAHERDLRFLITIITAQLDFLDNILKRKTRDLKDSRKEAVEQHIVLVRPCQNRFGANEGRTIRNALAARYPSVLVGIPDSRLIIVIEELPIQYQSKRRLRGAHSRLNQTYRRLS
jgi:hypothetical protein